MANGKWQRGGSQVAFGEEPVPDRNVGRWARRELVPAAGMANGRWQMAARRVAGGQVADGKWEKMLVGVRRMTQTTKRKERNLYG